MSSNGAVTALSEERKMAKAKIRSMPNEPFETARSFDKRTTQKMAAQGWELLSENTGPLLAWGHAYQAQLRRPNPRYGKTRKEWAAEQKQAQDEALTQAKREGAEQIAAVKEGWDTFKGVVTMSRWRKEED